MPGTATASPPAVRVRSTPSTRVPGRAEMTRIPPGSAGEHAGRQLPVRLDDQVHKRRLPVVVLVAARRHPPLTGDRVLVDVAAVCHVAPPLTGLYLGTPGLAPHLRWEMHDPPESAVSHGLVRRPMGQACVPLVVVAHRYLPATIPRRFCAGPCGHLLTGEAPWLPRRGPVPEQGQEVPPATVLVGHARHLGEQRFGRVMARAWAKPLEDELARSRSRASRRVSGASSSSITP